MDRERIYDINNRTVIASAATLNKLATECVDGACTGSLKHIALFAVRAEQAWDATRREIGMRYWTGGCRELPD